MIRKPKLLLNFKHPKNYPQQVRIWNCKKSFTTQMEYKLENFRDNSDGCSVFTYWKPTECWACGGTSGIMYFVSKAQSVPDGIETDLEGALTAMSLNKTSTRMAFAETINIYIKNMEDQSVGDSLLGKRSAVITHLDFSSEDLL